jgi:hypothetical protein
MGLVRQGDVTGPSSYRMFDKPVAVCRLRHFPRLPQM